MSRLPHLQLLAILLAVTALGSCGSATGPDPCAATFPGNVCLDMRAAEDIASFGPLIESETAAALEVIQPLIGATGVRIVMIADPQGVIPEIGLGGFNPGANEVRIFADPGRPDLAAVIRDELRYQLAHEIHHAMRRRSVGYGSTLFQAAVTEGLADHFAIAVSGRTPPPWTTALSAEQLAQWLPEVTVRTTGPYNHAAWFVGADTIPRWTGYAVGFELVRRYLAGNPGASAAALVGAPAGNFAP